MLQRGADVDATSVQGLPEESVHRTVLKGSTDWSNNKGTIDIDDMYADGFDERCVDGIRKQHIAPREDTVLILFWHPSCLLTCIQNDAFHSFCPPTHNEDVGTKAQGDIRSDNGA